MSQELTLDVHGCSSNSLAEVIMGTANVDALVITTHASDVQRHVTEVVSSVDARACQSQTYIRLHSYG